MIQITPDDARKKSGGYPVWRDVIGPDNRPTGKKVHHENGQMAVVVDVGPVQEDTTNRGREHSHPDQDILFGLRA